MEEISLQAACRPMEYILSLLLSVFRIGVRNTVLVDY